MMAHNVIFKPALSDSEGKGTVFVFGGLASTFAYQPQCFKYDVAKDNWTSIPDMPGFRMSFNLTSILNHRFILVVSHNDHVIFDT